ncbi:MAG: hypothetical protein SF187_30630 [Deltaproteobacteria bacterium]|nr:hypothetical protein [Deltaproteobacteria bacterium]
MADISDFTMFLIFMLVVCVPVIFFWGPAMWSSDTEFIFFRLWRWLRGKKKLEAAPPSEASQVDAPKDPPALP